MSRRLVVALVVCVCLVVGLVTGTGVGVAASGASAPPSNSTEAASATPTRTSANDTPDSVAIPEPSARIRAVYPNPRAPDDRGEFVLVAVGRHRGANTTLRLSDGETTVRVRPPPDTGVIAVTSDPARVRDLTDVPVVGVGRFELANRGERVVLRRGDRVADAVTYPAAPEGDRWVDVSRTPGGTAADRAETHTDSTRDVRPDGLPTWRWLPLGFDPRPVVGVGATNATAFVLPDASGPPVETLRGADDRVLLAGYTLTSRRVADALVAAADRGATVRVLVDDAPVGGLSSREARVLDSLLRRGVDVRVVGGDDARFRFHHAKYAVADDRAVVLTENWKPAGTGGRSSRGWGVRLDSPAAAARLAALFHDDFGARDATRWSRFRRGRTFTESDPTDGRFPSRIQPASVTADRVRVLTAPGNAESAVVRTIADADRRVDVIQPTIGDRNQPMLRAAVRAARRGVRVRILLSGAWYVADDNRRLVDDLNRLAERGGLPLSARVAAPHGRYEKIHAKGLVADDTVVVGSLNWNNVSARENREVAVALSGGDAAPYYRRAFDADWRASRGGSETGNGSGDRPVPLGVVVGSCLAAALAVRAARRIEFGP